MNTVAMFKFLRRYLVMRNRIRVLHTSDWHLGQSLHEHQRDDEFDKFLDWILRTVEQESVDVLLISGDIFDTSNPAYAAQARYYDFCTALGKTQCQAVITSGNHDSATFIDVPASILERMNVHVFGQARFGINRTGKPEDEVIVIRDKDESPALIVAAVPYLTDGDVRYAQAGEDIEDRQARMRAGVAEHYRQVAAYCEQVRAGRDIPVVAMGHLYVNGGAGSDVQIGDGVRATFVGNLGGVGVSMFDETFDYVALGHIHIPQAVGGRAHVRYSGSPLAMGFGEAEQKKSVCLVDFESRTPQISLVEVPPFHKMARVEGDKAKIEADLTELASAREEVYVSVIYTGSESVDSVLGIVHEILDKIGEKGGAQYICCLDTQNRSVRNETVANNPTAIRNESLEDFDEYSVFEKLLDARAIADDRREELKETYQMLLELAHQQP